MQREFVTSKVMLRPVGDNRLTHGSGPVKITHEHGVELAEPRWVYPDPEGTVSRWDQVRPRPQRQRDNNPIHQQPSRPRQTQGRPAQYDSASMPSRVGCEEAATGLHHWMRNGLHPTSKKQRWLCRHCDLSTTTE